MKKLIADKIGRIVKSRKQVEKELDVKLTIKGKEVSIEGNPENEYYAEKIIDALNLGFTFEIALLIKEEDYVFEIINIKDHTKRKDLERIRGRIIGTKGKTLKVLEGLTKCFFEVKDNTVGVIGDAEHIEGAQEGIISLIRGSKQSKVYNYLEKHQVQPVYDLGLKNKD
ncbi:hypothetical protein HYT24_01890 [Candidatus Pacearchaeota archaeon]|nr:hypothetical protein [Candidatus Pacearchaeota archaeon]